MRPFAAGAVMALALACGPTAPPPPAPAAHLVERSHETMGTRIDLTAWTSDEPRAAAAFGAVFGEFDRLDALMSVWKDGSDVLRLNAAAGDHPVPVSAETFRMGASPTKYSLRFNSACTCNRCSGSSISSHLLSITTIGQPAASIRSASR